MGLTSHLIAPVMGAAPYARYDFEKLYINKVASLLTVITFGLIISAWSNKWYQSKVMGSNPLVDTGEEIVDFI